MRYWELLEGVDTSAVDSLVSAMLDILTPLASNGVEYVTIDQLADKLSSKSTGQRIDRELIMSVLDVNEFPLVHKIEGDYVYLTHSVESARSVSDEQQDQESEKITQTAQKQAIKNIKK